MISNNNTSSSNQSSSASNSNTIELLSSVLVFQSSTNVSGKNKYWQFCITHQDDNDGDTNTLINNEFQTFYLQSRHGITKKDKSGKAKTSRGACYQKAFQSQLQAQKELLSRIHSKLQEGYVWIHQRRKSKFPLHKCIKLVNGKLQEQFDKFKNM